MEGACVGNYFGDPFVGMKGDGYGGGGGGGVGGCREGMQVFGKRRRKMGRENVGKM